MNIYNNREEVLVLRLCNKMRECSSWGGYRRPRALDSLEHIILHMGGGGGTRTVLTRSNTGEDPGA